jgi:hypothetical protein
MATPQNKGTDIFSIFFSTSSIKLGLLVNYPRWSDGQISSHSPAAMVSVSFLSALPVCSHTWHVPPLTRFLRHREAAQVPFIFARIKDQMHMVRHKAIGIDAATIGVLPFPQVFKVMPIIPIRDENGLPILNK